MGQEKNCTFKNLFVTKLRGGEFLCMTRSRQFPSALKQNMIVFGINSSFTALSNPMSHFSRFSNIAQPSLSPLTKQGEWVMNKNKVKNASIRIRKRFHSTTSRIRSNFCFILFFLIFLCFSTFLSLP